MQIMACTLYVDKRNEIKSPILYWLLYFVIEMSLFKIGAWFTLLFLEDIYNNYKKPSPRFRQENWNATGIDNQYSEMYYITNNCLVPSSLR